MNISTLSRHLASGLSQAHEEAQSVIERCLRTWRRQAAPRPSDAERLHALQHFIAQVFEGCWIDMSTRDRELYRLLIRCPELDRVAQRRFECFDLMCRLLGERAARQHLRQIDTWLSGPR